MSRRAIVLLALLVGCADDPEPLCPPEASCATSCKNNEDCGVFEHCNKTGRCQRSLGCIGNTDCSDDEMCDATLGLCVPRQTCLRDLHCAFGSQCVAGECTPGCRTTADCPLYQSCAGNVCVDVCTSNDFCALGAVCAGGTCYASPNPSHCAPCSLDRMCPFPGADFCLINQSYDNRDPSRGTARYCGVDCLDDPSRCPNGYVCDPVVLLTDDPCERDIHCGRLDRHCLIQEGAPGGFCSCARDLDCKPETLPPKCRLGFCEAPVGTLCGGDDDCSRLEICGRHGGSTTDVCVTDGSFCDSAEDCLCADNRCINTGRPCSIGTDCRLTCVGGLCLVGAACSPAEGLYCPDLTLP